jgi:hypothetical protein
MPHPSPREKAKSPEIRIPAGVKSNSNSFCLKLLGTAVGRGPGFCKSGWTRGGGGVYKRGRDERAIL